MVLAIREVSYNTQHLYDSTSAPAMATCWLASGAKNPSDRKKLICPGGVEIIWGNISLQIKLG